VLTAAALWAKLKRKSGTIDSWHSLIDHSADVAAVMEALLTQPTIRRRLAHTAGLSDLDNVTCSRLAALAFLHDIGKANRGFRARIDPKAQPIGHIDQLSWVFTNETAQPIFEALVDCLGLERIDLWFGADCWSMIEAVFAHHGRPWRRRAEAPPSEEYWRAIEGSDPVHDLAPLRAKLDLWFENAFGERPTMQATPLFQHAFAGLLMLADWLGSDEGFFPYANGQCLDRMAFARVRAQEAVRTVGLAAEPNRLALQAAAPNFEAAFGFDKPRPIQSAVEDAEGRLLVLEAETGSGKTEAALWRFKLLFERGLVDGLYFALPTRAAATQIFARVKAFRDRVFSEGDRPGVVLAIPGQAGFDDAQAKPLPDFAVQWNDDSDAPERWAAERPKRFLAATIAVGTIDQALLGAVRTKHAHMRGAALMRHLLVVDEVHASSVYAGELLKYLLRAHVDAGGHALLLSATLGGAMRANLLGTSMPSHEAAAAVAYPALSWAENGTEARRPIARDGQDKSVAVEVLHTMQDSAAVAALALAAAKEGAATLVIRNTVGAAIETARAVEELVGLDSAFLCRVGEVPTLHHSRFAAEDRALLDAEVEMRLGKARGVGPGVVVVGTQTLEISLDLDADLLITDLCPIDVLLQRIGRLHRHNRSRPSGYETPRLIMLAPHNRDLLASKLTRYGLGSIDKDGRGIYPDLRIIEATWRLAEGHDVWTIPTMNRALVEAATHPARLAEVEGGDPCWLEKGGRQEGLSFAQKQEAAKAALDRYRPFDECDIPRDERFGTRLGSADRAVTFDPPPRGPFGNRISGLRLPAFLVAGISPEAQPEEVVDSAGVISFRLGNSVFYYDRFGLRKTIESPTSGEI
jgi:CRISPR-associated endonuclease/helicase Cas3